MRQWYLTVLSRATVRVCRKARTAPRSSAGVERPPGRCGLAGGDGEARIEARQEALDHGLRLGDGGGRGEAQFGHEAVLERARHALHPALGLRRAGEDQADPQLGQRPRELGGRLASRALLGGGPEDGVAVAVQGKRDA